MKLPRRVQRLSLFACAAFAVGWWVRSGPTRVKAEERAVAAEGAGARGGGQGGGVGSRPGGRVPVLVELFTSEGCSSCPPADALLARLDREQPVRGAEIVVLSEHVDYWDQLGWKDRFSSSDFTERQKQYQGVFGLADVSTPQTVVNGVKQFNGSDGPGIVKAIEEASSKRVVPLEITGVAMHGDRVSFTLQNGPATPGLVNVYAALVDAADETQVRAGENNGRVLRHVGVVRTLDRIGNTWRVEALGEKPFEFKSRAREGLGGMRLVVFLQAKHVGPVLGAVSCVLGPAGPGGDASGAEPCPVASSGT